MSYLEDILEHKLKIYGFLHFQREYIFHPTRRWRFDFAFPELKIAVEIEGGIHLKGKRKSRHTTAKGFTEDCVKYNEAACLGWTVLRVTADQVRSMEALDWIYRMIEVKEDNAGTKKV